MTKLINYKEIIKNFYQKHAEYIHPLMKYLFSFFILLFTQQMFRYGTKAGPTVLFAVVSLVLAFLPLSVWFYVVSALIVWNLWSVSIELVAAFFVLFILCWLLFVRVDSRHSFLVVLTPVLFYLKLEYLLPVLVGMLAGFGGILPVAGGIGIYFFSDYVRDASALISGASTPQTGIGIERVVSLLQIDKKLLVILVAFCLTVFISAALYRMFHENAWMFSVIISNVAMAVILLSGRMIFELDYSIWRVFLEIVLAIGMGTLVQFFKGIGDTSRIERISFEDDEYIYFVKAVPKIMVSQQERSVTNIHSEEDLETN